MPMIPTHTRKLNGYLDSYLTSCVRDRRLQHELRVDPNSKGRSAITGRTGRRVWNFLSLKASASAQVFTEYPHLTIGLHDTTLDVYVTIPNGVRAGVRDGILGASYEDFQALVRTVTRRLSAALRKYPGASPMIVVVQRRYPTQRSPAIHDGLMHFDPRTAFASAPDFRSPVKHQPQWLRAAYALMTNRRSNLQLQIGADFPYDTCPIVTTPRVKEAAVDVWLACKPLIDAATG